jgi:hypothetical protein
MLQTLAVLSAMTVGGLVANAAPIRGILNMNDNDTWNDSTITFDTEAIGGTSPGAFSVLTSGNPATMFPGMAGQHDLKPDSWTASPVKVITTTRGGETFERFLTDDRTPVVSAVMSCSLTCIDITHDAFFTGPSLVNDTNLPRTFAFDPGAASLYESASTTLSEAGITAPAPEPRPLFLLGTALLGIVGLARRRFLRKPPVEKV